MQNNQYADAQVLLFDRKRAVRKQTRSVLNNLGFQKILESQELLEVPTTLSIQSVELMILAVDATDCGVLDLVDQIRRQCCGLDPFVPILLTTWDRKLQALQPVVNSGADDILLHPFSTTQMGERIGTLVRARKPFVVTETYLGPDRRTAAALRAGPPSIVVPNALQARVQGVREMAPSADRIEETLADLRRMKLRNLARDIWHLANCLRDATLDPTLPDRYDSELTKLGKLIRLYDKTLAAGDNSIMRRLCRSLSGVVKKQRGRPPVGRGLELLEQSALALRVASKLEYDENETTQEASEAIGGEAAKIGNVEVDLIRAVMG